MQQPPLKNIIEAILLAAAKPMTVSQLLAMLADEPVSPEEKGEEKTEGEAAEAVDEASGEDEAPAAEAPERDAVRQALAELAVDYEGRGFELKEVASGFRIQVRDDYAPWVSRLWEEKPPKYSRALLETLALIAYRQPITRAEIEDIRGVAVSSNIVKTLLEREWIRVVGHKELPGRPAMYATTRQFLDYFNLKSLAELPTLSELRDLEQISAELVEQGVIEPEAKVEGEGAEGEEVEAASAESEATESEPAGADDSTSEVEETPPAGDESGEVDEAAVPEEVFEATAEALEPSDEAADDESAEEAEPDRPMDELNGVDPSEEGA